MEIIDHRSINKTIRGEDIPDGTIFSGLIGKNTNGIFFKGMSIIIKLDEPHVCWTKIPIGTRNRVVKKLPTVEGYTPLKCQLIILEEEL